MLRLPDSMSLDHKMRQVDQVIDALDLKSCQNTIIGDYMHRGLSGGEKKRCSIACELLSNPAVMMLDEPTSSLDSCTALSLIKLLKEYAIKESKTIIISIHQPSSQIFYLFDKLLLLSQGQMIYFGGVQQVLPYFRHFNYHMQHLSYNPADFVMEVIKSVDDKERNRLSQEARECFFSFNKRYTIETGINMLGLGNGISSPSIGKSSVNQLQHQFVGPQNSLVGKQPQQHNQPISPQQMHHESGQDDMSTSIHSSWSKIYIYDSDDAYSFDEDYSDQCCKENKWPSSFLTQLYALTSRNFIDGKARMLSKLNWVQTIGLAMIAGAIWFQVKRSEETLTDIKGWMYFSTMYWMMFALFNAITSFPSECQVINKERKYNQIFHDRPYCGFFSHLLRALPRGGPEWFRRRRKRFVAVVRHRWSGHAVRALAPEGRIARDPSNDLSQAEARGHSWITPRSRDGLCSCWSGCIYYRDTILACELRSPVSLLCCGPHCELKQTYVIGSSNATREIPHKLDARVSVRGYQEH